MGASASLASRIECERHLKAPREFDLLEAMADSKGFPGERITGSAFKYRKPDVMFKYVAIHELGHTFGLCHADGLLRIMFTNASDEKKAIRFIIVVNTGRTMSAGLRWMKGRVFGAISLTIFPQCLMTRAF
jgi:hypothetical protein